MSRYPDMFARRRGAVAFGAFVMLGDPDLERSGLILDALVEGGADMIEVGIPFSDPIADGPVIQAAAERALARGATPARCLALLADFRRRHPRVPVGLLTYANLVLARGRGTFCEAAAEAGVDSLLIADVPVLEAPPFVEAARVAGLAPVLIAAPNTPRPTLRRLAGLCDGYTYCVARAGVTGMRDRLELDHEALFAALREFAAPPPVLGFGISRPEQVTLAREAGAAGVISGSAIVSLVESCGADPRPVRDFVRQMKSAAVPASLEPAG